jgi:histidyl-tRNA synthetase
MPRKPAKPKQTDKSAKPRRRRRFSRLRGMKDILFDEYRYWALVTAKAADLAAVYGFRRIDTPILEHSSLYEKSTGKGSDIVTKEMYVFNDKGGDKVALRPEATPGLVRAYIEHGMFNLPQPVKMFWIGPLFRHEKPQSGRLRQHYQFDLEMFGEENPMADAQIILVAYNFFKELQIDVQIQINSIGCDDCREEYLEKLLEFYKERGRRSKLCNDCRRRILKNPLRMLDCKEDQCQEMRNEAPQIVDYLDDDCREHFIKVLEYLDELDVLYNLNPFLVRGLDYYNRTVFEVWPVIEEGTDENDVKRQFSLGGGGRYDKLVERMGGRPAPALGFGVGLERTILKIKENGIPLKEDAGRYVFIAQLGEQAKRKALLLFEEMRRAGFNVWQSFTKDSLKAQLEEANRIGAKLSLILGQKEIMDGTIMIRDMESGIQEVIDHKKIHSEVSKRLEESESA